MIQGRLENFDLDSRHNQQHSLLFRFAQGVIDKTFTAVPTTDDVPVGYMAKYITGSTRRIYFNFDGTMTYFALTNA